MATVREFMKKRKRQRERNHALVPAIAPAQAAVASNKPQQKDAEKRHQDNGPMVTQIGNAHDDNANQPTKKARMDGGGGQTKGRTTAETTKKMRFLQNQLKAARMELDQTQRELELTKTELQSSRRQCVMFKEQAWAVREKFRRWWLRLQEWMPNASGFPPHLDDDAPPVTPASRPPTPSEEAPPEQRESQQESPRANNVVQPEASTPNKEEKRITTTPKKTVTVESLSELAPDNTSIPFCLPTNIQTRLETRFSPFVGEPSPRLSNSETQLDHANILARFQALERVQPKETPTTVFKPPPPRKTKLPAKPDSQCTQVSLPLLDHSKNHLVAGEQKTETDAVVKKPSLPRVMPGWTSNASARNFVREALDAPKPTTTKEAKPPDKWLGPTLDAANKPWMVAKKNAGFRHLDVVRKKAQRQALQGRSCPECNHFWDVVCRGNEQFFSRKHFQDCSRHRWRHSPPSTPNEFWELSFQDEMRARERPEGKENTP